MPSSCPVGRKPLSERWDLLPYYGMKAVAQVFHEGEAKYRGSAWRGYPFKDSDQSPLNHAIGHAVAANNFSPGNPERLRQMAKAAANLMMQIELEDPDAQQ